MDAAGIDMQVLSLNAPGNEQLEPAEAAALARDSNEFLADAVTQASRSLCRSCRAADPDAGQGRGRARSLRAASAVFAAR